MTAVPTSQLLNELADRESIRDCMYRYSRGVDRLDEAMLKTAYWPGAIDHHLAYKGPIEGFIEWSFPMMKDMENMHMISNIMIRMTGATTANVESYFFGLQRVKGPDGKPFDIIAGGRYLDKFEKRGEEWRIADRIVVTDWFRQFADSADWSNGPFGMGDVPKGQTKPNDISYRTFGWK